MEESLILKTGESGKAQEVIAFVNTCTNNYPRNKLNVANIFDIYLIKKKKGLVTMCRY